MTEQISNKDLFYQIPQTQNDPLWEEIKEKMNLYAPPEKVEGMEFFSREVLPVSKPVRRSGEDNSNLNLTRATNPDRDNLNTIETRGLNVSCYPPKTVITTDLVEKEPVDPIEEDLFGGYGRSGKFDELSINFWVYDRIYHPINLVKCRLVLRMSVKMLEYPIMEKYPVKHLLRRIMFLFL